MKVYELMTELTNMPAGSEVRIRMLKSLDELPEVGDEMRDIDFIVKEVEENGNYVDLDGWAE